MLAIIPARGGSKGIPGKNIKQLCGKPLIVYTIEAAVAAKFVDRIILSTDDPEIAKIASKYDIEIPFMRPAHLAQDDSLAIDNYIYTLDQLNTKNSNHYDEFIVLQPTSPFRTASDIDNAILLFHGKKADSVISVHEASHPPVWAKKIDPAGALKDYFNIINIDNKNRQELEKAYIPNGSIFILKLSFLKNFYSYYSDNTYAFIMSSERSIDIDTPLDFEFAEFLLSRSMQKKVNRKFEINTGKLIG
ncbi:cytidylyltransferase domain-containing protein [Desulfonema magnum]|uniref:Acylneuraminate cytidylyltransferase family protein n=1 Tax=Desulfonema magnum TaxID=45655 RepID=A0A975BXP9_9BACT|nr:acylneuraminate cytidylyltransferase family protein [Desulfonema magnum]QTA93608.1 Acylneuraminate cytidylyltransferase family protein [Desulfonema magnum]